LLIVTITIALGVIACTITTRIKSELKFWPASISSHSIRRPNAGLTINFTPPREKYKGTYFLKFENRSLRPIAKKDRIEAVYTQISIM
jgi:hypothetical protein